MSTTLRIPKGGLILVTGANGYIASHLVDQLIKQGYRVRGTVRDSTAQAWMTSHFGPSFSLVQVPDLAAPNALDEAVKGVDGIAHVASNVQFSHDAEAFIPPVVKAMTNVLEAAAKEPNVKSVVYCSSQAAVYTIQLNVPFEVTVDTWNESSIEAAWNKDAIPDTPQLLAVYSASKTLAEKGAFDWVKEHQPSFAFNTIIPNVQFGGLVSLKNQGFRSIAGLVKGLWDGFTLGMELITPQWCCYVEDTVLLHIAALVLPGVKNERIFSMAHRFDWNEILDIFKKNYPDHKFLDSLPDVGRDMVTIPNERGVELLRQMGRPGWTSLEEAIIKAVEPILAAEGGAEYPPSELDKLLAEKKAAQE